MQDTRLEDALGSAARAAGLGETSGIASTALVAIGDRTWVIGDRSARYVVYSLTKPILAAGILQLADQGRLSLDDPAPDGWPGTVRQLLDHTSGARDYGALLAYHDAVRNTPSIPWTDDEFLERASAAGATFDPGTRWAYSNTGYLLLRRLLDVHGGLRQWLSRFRLGSAVVAESQRDLLAAVPARSSLLLDGVTDVRGVYDPHWVGHRSLVATVEDLLGFWRTLPSAMLDPATFVPIGREAPGFVQPSYGLGLMADPAAEVGLLVGHGGGGPGYAGAVFAVPAADALAIVLTADERFDAQSAAKRLLAAALRG